jgi:hypothetical protein
MDIYYDASNYLIDTPHQSYSHLYPDEKPNAGLD